MDEEKKEIKLDDYFKVIFEMLGDEGSIIKMPNPGNLESELSIKKIANSDSRVSVAKIVAITEHGVTREFFSPGIVFNYNKITEEIFLEKYCDNLTGSNYVTPSRVWGKTITATGEDLRFYNRYVIKANSDIINIFSEFKI